MSDTEEPSSGRGHLIAAIPNVSTGRDDAVLAGLRRAFASGGAMLADVHHDVDHDRSVFTVIGTHDQLLSGLVDGAEYAIAHIDLRTHAGVHPRLGALDVLPIVALDELDIGGAADQSAAFRLRDALAPQLGACGVPVIQYGMGTNAMSTGQLRAAHDSMQRLQHRVDVGEVHPVAGPTQAHPTAGMMLLGVRSVLIAFNVELASRDLDSARHIAEMIRERNGGLPGVRSLAFPLPSRAAVQVSCNIERWKDAGPAEVLERVADLAAVVGLHVSRAELVGLAPREALHDLRIACRRNRVRLSAASEPVLEIRARLARERQVRQEHA